MAAADDLLALNEAPSQADRARAAPAPRRVKVDGRSLADLLAFAVDYGALIKFYDLADVHDGDWSVFFGADPSVAAALHASLDLTDIQAQFDRRLEELREAATLENRRERLEAPIAMIVRLGRILTRARPGSADLDRALSGLAGSDRRDLLAGPARRLELHLGGNSLDYGLRHDRDDWFPELLDHLEALADALVTALDQGRAAALAALEASFQDHSHPPQSGLYDAFAKLFGHAQASINRFSERLIRFYQSDVLRQTGRPGTPDRLCLTFTPAKGVGHTELPRGTRFLAGTDSDGESILYSLDSALDVDAASIAALRTLTVTTESPGGKGMPIPAQVLSGIVALSDKAPALATPFPIFGATTTGTNGILTTAKATIGFAVVSPTLMLSGGTRAAVLCLTMTTASLSAVTERLESWGAAAGGMAPADVFVQVMEAAFALRYSTAGGWVDIPSYQVTPCTPDYPLFALAFVLFDDADPFVALSTEPAAADAEAPAPGSAVPDPDTPALVASLLQDPVKLGTGDTTVTVYPYALLSLMKLSALSIDVEVIGLADLQASTPAGPVDTSQPFLVFGSPPVQDASLEVAAPELFAKRVDDLELAIDWFGLPVTTTGFYGYYKAYVIDADGKPALPPGSQFDNQSFRGKLDVVNPGWWNIRDTRQYLFRTEPKDPVPRPDGPLQPETMFIAPVEPQSPPPFFDPASSAIRLRLTEPDTAFGNVLYAANVMAASVRLTAAASACAQKCGQPTDSGATPVDTVIAANATAPDSTLGPSVRVAAQRTVAELDGAALKAIEDAIAASDAEPEAKQAWHETLTATLARPKRVSLLRRLLRWWSRAPDSATVHANLVEWLHANAESIAPAESAVLGKAHAMLEAGSAVLAVQERVGREPAAVSRPLAAAGLRDVQARLADTGGGDTNDCIDKCMKGTDLLGFPNQPWLPMAAGIRVNYTASTAIPPPANAEGPAPATLFHLLPFDGVEAVTWEGSGVPLLTRIDSAGALFVGLSEPAEQLTLLFRLEPPASGWPTDTPPVSWAQLAGETDPTELIPLRDTTNNLRNTGIVSLTLADPVAPLPWLRVSAPRDAEAFPMLAGLATNAAMASWVGPGGAATLGQRLPAGTITLPASPLPDIGSIDQPMPSSGGAPPQTGSGFEMWLAERLRHKDRGIQGWDYSNLLLAAFPSLWQVAIVPASDGGAPAPGHVWVVAVPGPATPDVADPTIPSADATTLSDIAAFLATRISPFIQLTVTNPPYLPITVHADLLFTNADTLQANIERLNDELVRFLSPWPPAKLPPRPADYYTRKQVARFIRDRPYVRAIRSLQLVPDIGARAPGWHYLTSASSHCLSGKAQPDFEPAVAPLLAIPRNAPADTGRSR